MAKQLKSVVLRRAPRNLKFEVRKAQILRKVYKNWFSIWVKQFVRHDKNVVQAILRSGFKLHSKGGHRFNNLFGLAQVIQDGWQITEATRDYVVVENPISCITMKCRINVGYDLSFLAFVFAEKIYRKDFSGKTVIDAGSYIGDTAIYFATSGATRVIGLEPYRENLDLALENVNTLNRLGNKITLLQAALSPIDGQTDFRIFEAEPNGNRIASYATKYGTTIEARAITVESIMKEYGLERVNVLKMNCEGAEYDIIESLSDRTASMIDEIYIEFHNGPERIIASLQKLGYTVEGGRRHVKYGHLRAVRKDIPVSVSSAEDRYSKEMAA